MWCCLLQVLKDKAVDPMQALIPCHITPGEVHLYTGYSLCGCVALLGPLEVYLPNKCGHSEASKTLVQVSVLSPPLFPPILPLSDGLVVCAVSASKKGGAR